MEPLRGRLMDGWRSVVERFVVQRRLGRRRHRRWGAVRGNAKVATEAPGFGMVGDERDNLHWATTLGVLRTIMRHLIEKLVNQREFFVVRICPKISYRIFLAEVIYFGRLYRNAGCKRS